MTLFIIDSRRKSAATLERAHPGALFLDVTSKGPDPWVQFSPFYPHGGIPVPFLPGRQAVSVEGIWQGLKVFESADIDESRFDITSMKGIKRTVRRFGRVRGHCDPTGGRLLSYRQARYEIYLPAYLFVLENKVPDLVEELRRLAKAQPIVLLDYETNIDVNDLSKPLSHASLIMRHLQGDWPTWSQTVRGS